MKIKMGETKIPVLFLLAAFLLTTAASAYEVHIDRAIAKLRCGNGVRDTYELCEKNGEDLCPKIAEWRGIDTQCDYDQCICLPPINLVFCGNNRLDGVELCDGTGEDLCPKLGELMGLKLKCNSKCGCDFVDPIPKAYDPAYVEELKEKSGGVCGNKVLDPNEECDPPNTLCTTTLDEPGVCDKNCNCVTPETLLREESEAGENVTNETENIALPSEETTENVSGVSGVSEESTENISENITGNITDNNIIDNITAAPKSEKLGFFARLWRWIVKLFS